MSYFALRMAPGRVDKVPKLLPTGLITIGWSETGDLTAPTTTKAEIRSTVAKAYPSEKHPSQAATHIWRFLREFKVGDVVLIPHGKDIYFVRVSGPATFDDGKLRDDTSHTRPVVVLNDGSPLKRDDLPSAIRDLLKFRQTTRDLSAAAEDLARFLKAASPRWLADETKRGVRDGLDRWRKAFEKVGTNKHGQADRSMFWVQDLGIWLLTKRQKGRGVTRYWNGLGDRPGSRRTRNLIVEVNPPDGGMPGRWQGLVASDGEGKTWLLHSGELNVGGKRVLLRDYPPEISGRPVEVAFSDATVRNYFKVARLSDQPIDVVRQTKSFMDACARVRTRILIGDGLFAELQRKAQLFDESIGQTVIPPQPQKLVDRLHARIWTDMVKDLRSRNFDVANEHVSSLGPDLYTVRHGNPYLIELKTASGSSDYLKGVGQLLVYELVLQRKFRKLLVLPENVTEKVVSYLGKLNITVVPYRKEDGSWVFSWPQGFAPD